MEAYKNLLMSYSEQCTEVTIPCFVSDTVPADKHLTPTYQYAITSTRLIHLAIHSSCLQDGIHTVSGGDSTSRQAEADLGQPAHDNGGFWQCGDGGLGCADCDGPEYLHRDPEAQLLPPGPQRTLPAQECTQIPPPSKDTRSLAPLHTHRRRKGALLNQTSL